MIEPAPRAARTARHTLVTGGAGFIGSHLVERLLEGGDRVTVIDDLSTGRRANLERARDDPRLELVVGSVLDRRLVAERVGRVDRVVHLAAAVGVRLVVERPAAALRTNLRGTEVVLRAAARRGIPALFASSSEVYGTCGTPPFVEDTPLHLPATREGRAGYAHAKATGECLALALHRERGAHTVVARLFNSTGPRQRSRWGMVLPTFVRQALDGEPLTVHGDGSQTRCFAHVRDTVEALVRLLGAPAASGLVVNVGSDRETRVDELARLVVRETGSTAGIVHVPHESVYGPGFEDPPRRVPDLTRLEELTGFRPSTPLGELVRDAVEDRLGARVAG
jgi:UDP-glucose 4-epimerase